MYRLDAYLQPGVVVMVMDNHASYIAENFSQAETFAQRLQSDAPIALPEPSDAEALIARVLARVAAEPQLGYWLEQEPISEPRAEGDTSHMYYLPAIP
jgi:hypothetical protein